MTATINTYTPWECSAAFEQKYAEDREFVARMLQDWGCRRNTDWPARAAVSDVAIVPATAHWLPAIFRRSGMAGIHHNVDSKLIRQHVDTAFPNKGISDVYFVEQLYGNVQHGRIPTLAAYIPLHSPALGIYCIKLGCNHQGASIIKDEINVRTWHCPRCDATWGEDRGD